MVAGSVDCSDYCGAPSGCGVTDVAAAADVGDGVAGWYSDYV